MWRVDSPLTAGDREPRFRSAFEELLVEIWVNLDPAWGDGFELPAVGERLVQLPSRHPTRPVGSRFLVAGTHDKQPPARLDHTRQPCGVTPAVVIGEDMEQAAVDLAREALASVSQRCRVLDQELDG